MVWGLSSVVKWSVYGGVFLATGNLEISRQTGNVAGWVVTLLTLDVTALASGVDVSSIVDAA
ncbi:hypothetical protein HK096_009093, partial [Nowakowskiella sp. JEL0078]